MPRFLLKKAHLSRDDYRVWEAPTGQLVAVSHHFGKNPYSSLDPLGLSGTVAHHDNKVGEWESVCHVSGYRGMPALKIRPKTMSAHGRQYIQDASGQHTHCNVGKESRLKSMSVRHNLAVRRGRDKEVVYRILVDLSGRTMQVVNAADELVALMHKSPSAMLLSAAFGGGSEVLLDVAPGVDWTAMVALMIGVKQVGAHFVSDAIGNFVTQPLQEAAVGQVVAATGLQQQAEAAGHAVDSSVHVVQQLQHLYNMFYK
ncbi:hypothetical protein GPECTOR_57g498 [Gonium pectorale]|uniref:Uncharacterized protein n=1 Tax=Gonium pectorale TaxID=33097 RepID=A0A150G5W1_GONPE|nr:hypothetical protein GPECTOR_57g498 [Gonium pectorale]|eukprot:KXZ45208.1 hypothetical protein GPECTOR_57g498 [Gonium pectorale]